MLFSHGSILGGPGDDEISVYEDSDYAVFGNEGNDICKMYFDTIHYEEFDCG